MQRNASRHILGLPITEVAGFVGVSTGVRTGFRVGGFGRVWGRLCELIGVWCKRDTLPPHYVCKVRSYSTAELTQRRCLRSLLNFVESPLQWQPCCTTKSVRPCRTVVLPADSTEAPHIPTDEHWGPHHMHIQTSSSTPPPTRVTYVHHIHKTVATQIGCWQLLMLLCLRL